MNSPESKPAGFPATFWTANTIELFERGAYYAMASFVVIYLTENLGMSPTFATFLNGSLLWGLIYFLPIVSGTLADKYGFKRSLVAAFVMLSLGYLVMGNVQSFWPAGSNFTIPVLLGIVLIGLGGSIVKPCIAGTVQKTSGLRATLGFGIFYMVINIGSISGRGVSYFVRRADGHPGHLFPGGLRLRHRRPADRVLRLPRTANTSPTAKRTARPCRKKRWARRCWASSPC